MVSWWCQVKAGQSTECDGSRKLFLVTSYCKLLAIFLRSCAIGRCAQYGRFPLFWARIYRVRSFVTTGKIIWYIRDLGAGHSRLPLQYFIKMLVVIHSYIPNTVPCCLTYPWRWIFRDLCFKRYVLLLKRVAYFVNPDKILFPFFYPC